MSYASSISNAAADGLLLSHVKKFCNHGFLHDAIHALDELVVERRVSPIPVSTFYCLLKSCKATRDLKAGRHVNWLILMNGLENDAFLGCHLVHMFASCGSLSEADRTFRRLPTRDAFTWTAAISAHLVCNCPMHALGLYVQMQEVGIDPNAYTFNVVLQACSAHSNNSGDHGNVVYSHMVERGLNTDAFLCNTLIDMFVKRGCLLDARNIFDMLLNPSIVAWSSMITGYAHFGDSDETIHLFQLMLRKGQNPNVVTFLGLLKACCNECFLNYGRCVHFLIIATSRFEFELAIVNSLIDMYTRCGSLDDVESVFHEMPYKSLVTWSAMFSSYARYGCGHIALELFSQMQYEGVVPDSPTFVGVLQSCRGREMLHEAKCVHIIILHRKLELEDLLGSIIIDMYFKCSSPMDACKVFESLPRKCIAPWNTFIGGFSEIGQGETALHLFQCMQEGNIKPNNITYTTVAKACVNISQLSQGELLYTHVISNSYETNEIIGNALLSMYAKHGSLENARGLFDRLTKRDVISWSVMISGYVEHGYGQQALHLFGNMRVEPDIVAFLSAIKACSLLSALHQGILVHAQVVERGCESDVSIGNSLIDMYAKCGSLNDASSAFAKIPTRTVTTWNAMIGGCSHHSNYELALKEFEGMQKEGMKPNDATYVSILSVCNHLGLVSEGCSHFRSMWADNNDDMPYLDHYACVMELLGRAGFLKEAICLAMTCPFEMNLIMWTSLLSRCKSFGDVALGKQCFDSMNKLGSYCASGYGVISNFYGFGSMQEDVHQIEILRENAESMESRVSLCG